MKFKWLTIPTGSKEVSAVCLWEVRWFGRTGIHFSDWLPMVEAFPERSDAEEFARRLREAFRLLRVTGEKTDVTVREQPPTGVSRAK